MSYAFLSTKQEIEEIKDQLQDLKEGLTDSAREAKRKESRIERLKELAQMSQDRNKKLQEMLESKESIILDAQKKGEPEDSSSIQQDLEESKGLS